MNDSEKKSSLKILFMDDDERIREIVCKHLKHVGYNAEAATNGDEAVEAYRREFEAGARFDAVVLDLSIKGGGMSGIETMQKILEIDPAAIGILSTGYLADPAVRDFATHGFAGVIEKPYGFSEFNQKLLEVTSK